MDYSTTSHDSRPFTAHPPTNPVFVLDNGIRVPMDMRYRFYDPDHGHVWEPVIEGDVANLMPRIVQIDADDWPRACHVLLPGVGSTKDDLAWARRIIDASPVLKSAKTHGRQVVAWQGHARD